MAENKQKMFRMIPAMDRLLTSSYLEDKVTGYPRNLVQRAINIVLKGLRQGIDNETIQDLSALDIISVSEMVLTELKILSKPSLRPVINATGVVIHTNLGRSILGERVLKRFPSLAGGYSNLEYDLDQGKRGSRYRHVEELLKEITNAEAAMVVNNNAAAVFLVIETLARGDEVIISRGELVEIGGSFRVPDVILKSGARIREVGTTNKTHLKDYEKAIGPDTGLLLKVHKSNFHIIGFTEEVDTSELAALGRKHNLPVVEDLGSGCLVDFTKYGLPQEPSVQEVLAQGADLVTFSGDKLLGGPQAGLILGRKELVEAIKKNQLTRALRIDKLTLLALEETLNIYRDERTAIREIPTLRMLCQPYEELKKAGQRLSRMIGKLETEAFTIEQMDGNSKVGGGAMPLLELPSRLVCLVPRKMSANSIGERLKLHDPPIIARVEKDNVLLDVRTIQANEFRTVAGAVRAISLEK